MSDESIVCLNSNHGGCGGDVIYRELATPAGHAVPRCDQHQALAVERAEEL
ncbi:hypothetical protein [Streptomyces sp. G1]|uniref:hypothetical protein n=1 Tax=Streptomyces sp. G1 TaxID=361572 RepID=UPI00202F2F61|nr:hypothetical protein [Streptomyces sp. G1]MCM1967780.1 hypothetical protein [Streptomyces sp. G1]